MASPFQRYQGGIEASTGNLVPAYGQMAQMTAGAIAGFGKSIADGLQKYQENVQKDQILTQEAEMLGDQIMSFQKQFANNPEYAPFAQSLQPHIDKLAKVPTMSLAQKMGTVTGVKAAFANISPMLQAFEVNKASMLQQDINKARAGVTEYDTVTVPTAIVAEGKMPYFYNKSYQENEAALVELAKQAQAKGAKIDIPSVVQKWREETKAGAMANNNIPPEIKEGLIKQIDSAKGISDRAALVEKAQKEGRGLTMEEAGQLFQGERVLGESAAAGTSVKSQLEAKALEEERLKPTDYEAESAQYDAQKKKNIVEDAKKELDDTTKLIEKFKKQVSSGEDLVKSDVQKAIELFVRGGEAINKQAAMSSALEIARLSGQEITPELADKIVSESFGLKGQAIGLGSKFAEKYLMFAAPLVGAGISESKRNLKQKEQRNIQDAFERLSKQRDVDMETQVFNDAKSAITALEAKAKGLQQTIDTGLKAPTAAEISKAKTGEEQAQPALPEQLAVTNLGAFSMGTRTEQVQRSIDDKRRDMATYFQNKYGYIPSGFEASFKAIYPEANFKTMETPYGAFMYDGKEWKQIATPQAAKPMSPKEAGEAKSYVFGQMRADGTQEFKEFLPNSGVYMRGIFSGSEKEKQDFRERMYAATRAKRTVGRLIEINDMLGESMPWNAAVQGEAKALLPEIMAALRPEIVGVGTVSNYEQEMIRDVVADPTKFFSLEASDRAKLLVIASRIDRTIGELPAVYDIEVKVAGQSNAEREKLLRTQMYSNPKSRREAEYEKTGKISWNQ